MKRFSFGRARRSGRACLSLTLTVAVIAVVLAFNLAFSAVAARNLWFLDLTGYTRTTNAGTSVYENFTLTDGCVDLLDDTFADLNAARQNKGEDPVAVELIFCDDPDNLMGNYYLRMVYLAALQLQKTFPDTISVRYIDVYKNPSAVQKYKSNAYTTIYPTTVIVASGTEYRRLSPASFFFNDDETSQLWAAKIEVNFASAIRAVTKAASPKCILLTNHGESGYADALLSLLDDAGYDVITDFDLESQEIPTDCRLMLCVDPVKDFTGFRELQSGTATVSEIAKLDAFLDDENSLMVFFDADTPTLPTLEEYLEKWGVSICRLSDASGDAQNYLLRDNVGSLSADGQTLVADYASAGLGKTVTSEMQSQTYPAKVVFRNATALSFSSFYRPVYVKADTSTGVSAPYSYGSYALDGTFRQVYDVFTAPDGSVAFTRDTAVEQGENTDAYKLMTIAKESVVAPGDRNGYTSISHDSYVVACASTEFLCDELLSTNAYGNADVLAGLLRSLGTDPMSALIEQYIKPFVSTSVEEGLITSAQKKTTTLWLTLLPGVVLFGLGIFVTTKRKHS